MEFTAKLNYVRVSPQKARLVLDLIKGRRVEEALDTLLFAKKGIAPQLYKLLRSAVENANYVSAEKGLDVDVDRLYVKRAIANDGPRLPLPAPHLAPGDCAGGKGVRQWQGQPGPDCWGRRAGEEGGKEGSEEGTGQEGGQEVCGEKEGPGQAPA